jgi:hypothetical protein
MHRFRKNWGVLALLVGCLAIAGCSDDDDDDDNGPVDAGPDYDRVYVQIERLGNPLVSEVMLAKRDHGHHNAVSPSADVANFKDDVEGFVRNVAGRSDGVATTLSAVLLPDMLIVDVSKDGSTAGWLSWALAAGYGGRKLTDDVVDAGLAAIFGSLLDSENVSPGLTTDNVDANDRTMTSTFPYLAGPH